MAWFGFAVGVTLLLLTASSALKTLLIPRPAHPLLTSAVGRAVQVAYQVVTDQITDLRRRERILSSGAPAFLLGLLVTWLMLLFLGFGLMLWPLTKGGLLVALRVSGSSLTTLGFDAPRGAAPTVVVFAAAASGLVVVALVIGYLPVLYAAFNRREILVTMLEALAANPAWGPELLARQALIDNVAYLPELYQRWTEWAADISESHANYRALIYFRSPDPAASWLLSLLAVLDAAALHLALCPRSAPAQARPLLRVGYVAIRKLAKSLRLPAPEDPHPDDPIAVTRLEYDEAIERMQAAGWEFERTPDDAWPHFRGWRVNYEAPAYAIAYLLNLPPALWSGQRRSAYPPALPPNRPPHRAPDGSKITRTAEPGRAERGGR